MYTRLERLMMQKKCQLLQARQGAARFIQKYARKRLERVRTRDRLELERLTESMRRLSLTQPPRVLPPAPSAPPPAEPRTLFIVQYHAEDAYPLAPNHLPSIHDGEIVRGRSTNRVRCTEWSIDLPQKPTMASFFAQQADPATGAG